MNRSLALLSGLRHRRVYKVGAAYCVGGWLLIQVVTQVFPVFEVQPQLLRYIVAAVGAGFPLALLAAWLVDRSRGQKDMPPEVAESPAREDAAPPAHSIAVLPFINATGNEDLNYLGDGLAEEVISELARWPAVKVSGRLSAFRFRGTDSTPQAIGQALGVALLLTGSVRPWGGPQGGLRLTVELVEARGGHMVWSHRQDGQIDKLLDLHSSLNQAVVGRLRTLWELAAPALLPGAGAAALSAVGTQDSEAYRLSLLSTHLSRQQDASNLRAASAALERAISLDPGYVRVRAQLGLLLTKRLNQTFTTADERRQLRQQLDQLVQDTLAAAPGEAQTHVLHAWQLMEVKQRVDLASVQARHALALDPYSVEVQELYAITLIKLGQLEEANRWLRQILTTDPMRAIRLDLALNLIGLGQPEAGLAELRRQTENTPKMAALHAVQVVALIELGRLDEAQAAAAREIEPFWQALAQCFVHEALGDRAQAQTLLQSLIADPGEQASIQIAEAYGQRGDLTAMLHWLEVARTHDGGFLREVSWHPFLRRHQSDPRFQALLAQATEPTQSS